MEFEMANADDPEEIIGAAQRSVITAMQGVLVKMKKEIKAPGLTWEQLEFFLETFKNKKATVITQNEAQ